MKLDYRKGIVLLLVIGSLFRFYGLDHESLANDELSTCYRSSFDSISSVISRGVVPDKHPPGYQILMFFVERSAGDSAVALRFPSAAAGVISIYLLFLLGRRLFSSSVGFLAAALMTFSPVHIWYSQEARTYSILILMVTLSIYILTRMLDSLREKGCPGLLNIVSFALLNILMEYFHYFGLLMVVLESGILLLVTIYRRKNILYPVAVCVVSALAFLPWIPVAMEQSGNDSYITMPGLTALQSLLFEYMSWSRILMVVFTLLVAAAFVKCWKNERCIRRYPLRKLAVPVLWAALPILSALAVSYVFVPVFTNRNLLVTLPAFFLLFSLSIHILLEKPRFRMAAGAFIVLLLAVQLLFIRGHYTRPHKSQFREVARFTAENLDPNNEYLIVASAWKEFYFDYYFQRFETGLSVDTLATMESDFPAVLYLIEGRNPDEIWFLWGHREPEEALVDSMKKYSEEQEYFPFVFAGIWRFSL